jgi:DNA repair protein RadC
MMDANSNLNSIKNWAEADRPREKLANKGKKALSDAELLAILLGSGNTKESAVGLAKRMLASFDNDLNKLGQATLKDLQKFNGIGPAKAISIAAALEVGIRRQATRVHVQPQITQSRDAYDVFFGLLADLAHEEFIVLVLSRSNRVIQSIDISSGGLSGTVVDVKKIFRKVLEIERAAAIILGHNHPSGNPNPSKADIAITTKIKAAGKLLDISVLDHIIVAGEGYTSLADEGLM